MALVVLYILFWRFTSRKNVFYKNRLVNERMHVCTGNVYVIKHFQLFTDLLVHDDKTDFEIHRKHSLRYVYAQIRHAI